jgi:hypothetical protein
MADSDKALIGAGIIGAIIGLAGIVYGVTRKPDESAGYLAGFKKTEDQGLFTPQSDKW